MARTQYQRYLARERWLDEQLTAGRFCSAFVGAAAVVAGGTVYASNKASSAANKATQAQAAAASDANALSSEQFQWQKDVYERDVRPQQQADAKLREKVINQQMAISDKQQAYADEQLGYWESTYKPVEEQAVADSENYDSAENVARRSGMAAASVEQQFSSASQQKARTLGRYGLNPNSSAFAAQVGQDSRAEALASAGAQTKAAFDTEDKAIALRAGVANFGRNMPNTASGYFSGSVNSGNSASATSASGVGVTTGAAGFMSSAYQSRIGGIYDAGNALSAAYTSQANQWNQVAAGFGQIAGAAGTAGMNNTGWAGFMAAMSDRRLKRDIRRVGQTDDGLPIYVFRYIEGGPFVMGVMAQELAESNPGAVAMTGSGMLMVDYSKVH